MSHLGLPVFLIALYVLIICNACYSSIDGAFSALSSIIAVDVVKRAPDVSRRRCSLHQGSIVVAGVIGAVVASSGIDYVNLVEIVFFLKSALMVPLALASSGGG